MQEACEEATSFLGSFPFLELHKPVQGFHPLLHFLHPLLRYLQMVQYLDSHSHFQDLLPLPSPLLVLFLPQLRQPKEKISYSSFNHLMPIQTKIPFNKKNSYVVVMSVLLPRHVCSFKLRFFMYHNNANI